MGLINLKDKIQNKITEHPFSECGVLYILIEIRKFIERGNKDLGDPNDLQLSEKDYPVINFFRNWVSHTQKNLPPPDNISSLLESFSNGNTDSEIELFNLLKSEIETFCKSIKCNDTIIKRIDWDSFWYCLKCILAEQPVMLLNKKWVKYNDSLSLIEI